MYLLQSHPRFYTFMVLILLMVLSAPSLAANLAANVILAKGKVTATTNTGKSRTLKRGAKIYSGEVINTGPKATVQLRFVDKALMTVKASSELFISTYLYNQKNEEGKTQKVLMDLAKGGFRTITGAIGRGDKSAYKVTTPAASVGIRGTNFEIQQESQDSFVMAVYSGGIRVENEAGSLDLGIDSDYNYTRVMTGQSPQGLLIAPASLNQNPADDVEEEETQQESQESEEESKAEEAENTEDSSAEESDSLEQATAQEADNSAVNDAVAQKTQEETEAQPEQQNIPAPDERIIVPDPIPELLGTVDSMFANPFSHYISDDTWDLLVAQKVTGIAMDLPYSLNDNTLQFLTQIHSPNYIAVNDFIGFDYSQSGQNTFLTFAYTAVDNSEAVPNDPFNFDTSVSLYIDVNINNTQDLLAELQYELNYNSLPFTVELESTVHGDRFVFKPNTDSTEYVSSFALFFDSSIQGDQLKAQMGGSNPGALEWFWQLDNFVGLASGSWNDHNDSPVFGSVSYGPSSYGGYELSFANITLRQELNAVDNFGDFINCITSGELCDIQIDDVAASAGIKWGAWISTEKDPLDYFQYSSGSITSFNEVGEVNLALFAERAEINQLQGSAHFNSRYTDCSDFSQCLGFADDGLVTELSTSFDVDFNTGSISNGQLSVHTQGNSHWQAQFNGHMYLDENNNIAQPEFYSDSLSGTVSDAHGQLISNNVVGNIGGVFVKPGDVAAGGFNLGTTDSSEKNTFGVFAVEQN